jgi:hypothetical protein
MGRHGRPLLCIAMLGAALVVLATGVRSLAAELVALPGNPAVALLMQGKWPSEEAFGRLLRSRERALALVPNPAWRIELGAAHLVQAMQAAQWGSDPIPLLDVAERELRSGLALAPADDVGWFWLATVEVHREDWPAAVAALRLSFASAPHDPEIAFLRAVTGLRVWPWLDASLRPVLTRELVRAIEEAPAELVMSAEDIGCLEELRDALATDPAAAARLATTESQLRGPL